MTPRRCTVLIALTGVVLLAVNVRPGLLVVSPLLGDIRSDLAMGPVQAGALGALPPLAFAAFGWVTPAVSRVLGLERLAWVCMLVAGLAEAARLVIGGAAWFLLLSLIAYGGLGMGNVLLPPLVRKYFRHRIGPVTGLYILLISVGTGLPALVAVPAADLQGWRFSVGLWAVFAATAAWPWLRLARSARTTTEEPIVELATGSIPTRRLLRAPLAWGLATVFGINSLNAYAMFAWLPTILTDAGVDPSHAGAYLSLFALGAIPLAVVVPWLTLRLSNPFPLVAAFAVAYAIGYLGLYLSPDQGTALWVAIAGLGPGAFPLTLTLVNRRAATLSGAAALSGFTQGVGYAVAGVGPFVVGVLSDALPGWAPTYVFLGATLVAQLAAATLVARPVVVEDQLGR